MIDLKERFDSAFDDEPAHRDISTRLSAGHRAVRRRRIGAGAGALAVVTALAGAGVAGSDLLGAQPDQDAPNVTDNRTDTRTDSATDGGGDRAQPSWSKDEVLRFSESGGLLVNPKYELLDSKVDFAPKADRSAIATVRAPDGEERYVSLIERDAEWGLDMAADNAPVRAGRTMLSWYHSITHGLREEKLVEFAPDGQLVAVRDGVKILEQRTGVDLGPRFADRDDWTAVARLLVDGEELYVSARGPVGDPGSADPVYNTDFADLDAFIADQRAAMGPGGEGNR